MHELYDDLMDMCETLSKELAKTNEKLTKVSGSISNGDLDYINKLTHAIKSVKTTLAMMESEESNGGGSYNGGSYRGSYDDRSYEGDMGMSNARGRGRNAKRDSMGRYSSERGYSRNDMMDNLYEMRDNAPDDRTRQEFDRMINKMQSM